MPVRNAEAVWTGTLKEGSGEMKFGTFTGPYTRASRFADGEGTNPEELLGAAHAGCYTMFLSSLISNAGFTPTRIETKAVVHLEDGPTITRIELHSDVDVPGLDDATLQEKVVEAKAKCPVSKALTGVDITAVAHLVG